MGSILPLESTVFSVPSSSGSSSELMIGLTVMTSKKGYVILLLRTEGRPDVSFKLVRIGIAGERVDVSVKKSEKLILKHITTSKFTW